MTPWDATVKISSPPLHVAYWANLRELGRSYYLHTCVLFWSSFALGIGCFIDLVYHFARFGSWRIGTLWAGITVFAVFVAFSVYSRRWASNEKCFHIYAQPVIQADPP